MKILIPALTVALFSGVAAAEKRNPILDETWAFTAGGYDLEADAKVSTRSNVFNQRKYTLDLDDLGLDTDVNTFWIDAKWKPFERWSFLAEYFSYSETARRTNNFEVVYEDVKFGANTEIKTEFDVDIYSLSAAYRVLDSQKAAIDLGLGIHALDAELTLKGAGDVYVNETTIAGDTAKEGAEILAPLPNVMAYGTYAFNQKWAVNGRVGWFSMNYEEYEGDLLRANASIEYRPIRNMGLGLGYNFSELEVTREQRFHSEEYNLDFSGPLFYIKGGF